MFSQVLRDKAKESLTISTSTPSICSSLKTRVDKLAHEPNLAHTFFSK